MAIQRVPLYNVVQNLRRGLRAVSVQSCQGDGWIRMIRRITTDSELVLEISGRRPDRRQAATGKMFTPRAAHAATLLPNGKVLIAGGETSGGKRLASAEL